MLTAASSNSSATSSSRDAFPSIKRRSDGVCTQARIALTGDLDSADSVTVQNGRGRRKSQPGLVATWGRSSRSTDRVGKDRVHADQRSRTTENPAFRPGFLLECYRGCLRIPFLSKQPGYHKRSGGSKQEVAGTD
jgi:hypothetical protein